MDSRTDTKKEFWDILEIQARAGLNTGQKGDAKFVYQGSIRLEKDWFIEMGYRAENIPTYQSNIKGRLSNSGLMLFGKEDYFDYYRREGISVTGGYRLNKWNSSTVTGTYLHEQHSGLVGNVSYDLFGRSTLQRPNGSILEGDLRTFTVAFQAGQDLAINIGPSRHLESGIEISVPGSDFDFRRFYLEAGGRITTLLQRRFLPATLDFGISLGLTSDGGWTLPPQRAFIVEGGTTIYHGAGALRSLRGLPYQGNGIVFGYWDHNFRTLFFEMLGLRWMVSKGYSVLVFGGHAFIRGAGSRADRWIDHHELGVSFGGIFGLMRLDFAYRIGEKQFYSVISVARIF